MLVFESVQGLAPMNVSVEYEIKKNIFLIYRVNGAFSMNAAEKTCQIIAKKYNFAIIVKPGTYFD